ncbi:MAG: DNA polymerase IV [Pikeienuella sp.]|uniref:DNA polymerase IV n=1 Tax=Pikeienuella sp. TaxID=2831957 RepID=UPI00391CC1B5
MPAFCRDCLARFEGAAPSSGRCPACRSPRLAAHPELFSLGVAHVDCDAFYAAVEKRDDPSLADLPLIVGGGRRGVVSTCCYIARIRGVRSAMPMFKALALCPEAVVVKPRMAAYVETSRAVRSLMEALTPLVEPLSLDEAFLDLRGTERLHGAPPALSLARLLERIEREVGVTASAGLSHNKFLAKTASDLDKPRGFSVIGREETPAFLAPRPVSSLWGVGASLRAKLEAEGLRTVADLRRRPEAELAARFGAMGLRLARLARGEDARAVTPDSPMKSISAETTFDADIAEREALEAHLWRLALRVSDRAKAKALTGRRVTLKAKTPAFRTITRQKALSAPTDLADALFRAARDLLPLALPSAPFRLIGLGLSDLAAERPADSPDLLDPAAAQRAKAERAADGIRARYGAEAIIKGRGWR